MRSCGITNKLNIDTPNSCKAACVAADGQTKKHAPPHGVSSIFTVGTPAFAMAVAACGVVEAALVADVALPEVAACAGVPEDGLATDVACCGVAGGDAAAAGDCLWRTGSLAVTSGLLGATSGVLPAAPRPARPPLLQRALPVLWRALAGGPMIPPPPRAAALPRPRPFAPTSTGLEGYPPPAGAVLSSRACGMASVPSPVGCRVAERLAIGSRPPRGVDGALLGTPTERLPNLHCREEPKGLLGRDPTDATALRGVVGCTVSPLPPS